MAKAGAGRYPEVVGANAAEPLYGLIDLNKNNES